MSTTVAAPARPAAQTEQRRFSTVGAKLIVALTGLVLVGFVIGHMLGNLLVFKGPAALNAYAKFLKDLGWVLWAIRLFLLTCFVAHIYFALRLAARNQAARPVPYQNRRYVRATWSSRYMVLTGLVVLAFVIFHLAHYTFGWVQTVPQTDPATGQIRQVGLLDLKYAAPRDPALNEAHDVYAMTIYGFRQWWITILYIVAQVFLGMHLYHGGSSMFQTLGLNHPRYNPLLGRVGLIVAVVVCAGNIAMPLAVATGLVGANYLPVR
jgi:succinate dehydrogenase / fumarate reductase cytochrome b subunit